MIKKSYKIVLFFLAVALSNCGGVPPTYYYRVDYEVSKAEAPGAPIPITLGVEKFSADILYEEDRIVYRNSPYEVQYYHYRRWIVPPRKIVEEKVLGQLEASGIFEKVADLPCYCETDFVLKGKIKAFEEWDEENSWHGLVTLAFELQNSRTQATIWKKEYSERTMASQKKPVAVVKAISESLKKVVNQAISEMETLLKSPEVLSR